VCVRVLVYARETATWQLIDAALLVAWTVGVGWHGGVVVMVVLVVVVVVGRRDGRMTAAG